MYFAMVTSLGCAPKRKSGGSGGCDFRVPNAIRVPNANSPSRTLSRYPVDQLVRADRVGSVSQAIYRTIFN
jgi:hypothetical protein